MYPRDRRGGLARLASESTALMEIGAVMALRRQLLYLVPEGDGHPVMLIPGFTATDRAMGYLRRFLGDCGYAACGWEQGRNLGVRRDVLDALVHRVQALADDSGQRVSLVGWSGGGMYARALGHHLPAAVRQVITLGTPFKLDEETLDYLPEERHQTLLKESFNVLNAGGRWISCEFFRSEDNRVNRVFHDLEMTFIRSALQNGDVTEEQIAQLGQSTILRQDHHITTVDEKVEWLKAAGFKYIEAPWRFLNLAVISGVR